MILESKFNHGDEVYIITKDMIYKDEECEICNNTGAILVKEKVFTCPCCNGYTRRLPDKEEWNLHKTFPFVIGKITIESCDKRYCSKNIYTVPLKIRYDLKATDGKNICTNRNEEYLFRSHEEAIAECNKRNKELVLIGKENQ